MQMDGRYMHIADRSTGKSGSATYFRSADGLQLNVDEKL